MREEKEVGGGLSKPKCWNQLAQHRKMIKINFKIKKKKKYPELH